MSRRDFEVRVFVSSQCAPKMMKRRMELDGGLAGEAAFIELAKHICDQIGNDSHMVIQTEHVEHRLGRWDVDEPSPAELIKPGLR